MRQRNVKLYLRRFCCGVVLICLVGQGDSGLLKAKYYYQKDKLSVLNGLNRQMSFLLVDWDRVLVLPISHDFIKSTYFFNDGKSQVIQGALQGGRAFDSQSKYQTADYQAYGEKIQEHNLNDRMSFGYNNEFLDLESRLIYLGARDYDARHQHFISMDSYHVWNKYNFADTNPITNIDPSGHLSKKQLIAISVSAVALLTSFLLKGSTAKLLALAGGLQSLLEAKKIVAKNGVADKTLAYASIIVGGGIISMAGLKSFFPRSYKLFLCTTVYRVEPVVFSLDASESTESLHEEEGR